MPPRDAERTSNVFDIYTIIFLALAVFIFLRLRSVLGQRTGRERPPYDPYSARDAVRSPATDKVVTLPPRPAAEAAPRPVEAARPPARALEGHRRDRLGSGAGLDAIVGGGTELRRPAFPGRRARRLRDDRHRFRGRRSPAVAQPVVARSLRRFRPRDRRARRARRNRRDAFRLDRCRHHYGAPKCAPAPPRSRCASSPSWFR